MGSSGRKARRAAARQQQQQQLLVVGAIAEAANGAAMEQPPAEALEKPLWLPAEAFANSNISKSQTPAASSLLASVPTPARRRGRAHAQTSNFVAAVPGASPHSSLAAAAARPAAPWDCSTYGQRAGPSYREELWASGQHALQRAVDCGVLPRTTRSEQSDAPAVAPLPPPPPTEPPTMTIAEPFSMYGCGMTPCGLSSGSDSFSVLPAGFGLSPCGLLPPGPDPFSASVCGFGAPGFADEQQGDWLCPQQPPYGFSPAASYVPMPPQHTPVVPMDQPPQAGPCPMPGATTMPGGERSPLMAMLSPAAGLEQLTNEQIAELLREAATEVYED